MKDNSLKMMIYKLLWNSPDFGFSITQFLELTMATKAMIRHEITNLRKKGVNIECRNDRYYLV